MFTFKQLLDLALLALFLMSLGLVILANEDPVARNALCRGTGICLKSQHAEAWNSALYAIGIGGLVSLIFYGLVVRLPEGMRRRHLKRSLGYHYRLFKRDCIAIFLGVAEGTYSFEVVDTLLDQKSFRRYFNENVSDSQTKWHAFLNKLDEYHLRELLTAMEVFRDEISFVLNNTDFASDRPFEFFKGLSGAIYSMKDITLDYDATKRLSRFLWSLFAGFDPVTGYRKEDIVKNMKVP